MYIKKIDSLRTFAVLSVILSHWIPKTTKVLPLGGIGVNWFFVISGFLITRILLTEKEKLNHGNITQGLLLKNFIARRTLRIFPVYYLSLLLYHIVGVVAGTPFFHNNIGYFLTYTSNFYFYNINSWDGYISHFWSLAVEEQFYLFWPVLILFFPQRNILHLILISIATGIIFPLFFSSNKNVNVLTPSCMSILGLGALLSYYVVYRQNDLVKYRKQLLFTGLTALLIFLADVKFHFAYFFSSFLFALFAALTIIYCLGIFGKVKLLDKVLDNPILISLGKISYGLYLFHNLMPVFWRTFIEKYFLTVARFAGISEKNVIEELMRFSLKFLLLTLFCSFSFKFFEKPAQGLKKYFTSNTLAVS